MADKNLNTSALEKYSYFMVSIRTSQFTSKKFKNNLSCPQRLQVFCL
jgi:hypothetical protein